MARKGIVALTVNYRLGVFGFFAHPELTKESPHHASGNQGLLDQAAALRWVQQNIAAFGGDPKRVTIAGESAGSTSVSAQMASPLSQDLIAGAIGESGALIKPTLAPVPLAERRAGGRHVRDGRGRGFPRGAPRDAGRAAARSHRQAQHPAVQRDHRRLLPAEDRWSRSSPPASRRTCRCWSGWNSEENNYRSVLGPERAHAGELQEGARPLYGEQADEVCKALRRRSTNDEVMQSATDLASDRFIAYSTWKWFDLHTRTGKSRSIAIYYARPRPAMNRVDGQCDAGLAGGVIREQRGRSTLRRARGAVHSAEIEYAMGNLDTNKVYAWTPDDYKVSDTLQAYFANFVKTGDPNSAGLLQWPASTPSEVHVMRIDVTPRVDPDTHRDRYLFLDKIYMK